eukprot:CAMPEP_0183791578 /NCGR_PEP_ID=MMETSP0803_2-20130417/1949_1 /TAXON_ID=195967 /ORGANISM="Crustomastix stigmata, Strain CCMP3273" /LENGTH=299 /DNA_ID=CAMNT_0026035897 /DNA_START=144 /DNA_END=1040 /DNA_ORIENTATION=-
MKLLFTCIRSSFLLTLHYLEYYLQSIVTSHRVFTGSLLYKSLGYKWHAERLFPVREWCPFLTKLNFWIELSYSVCQKRVNFFSVNKVEQKQYVEQFGIKTAKTLLQGDQSTLMRALQNENEECFALKAVTGARMMPVFVKKGDTDIVNNIQFDIQTVQETIEEGQQRNGKLGIGYVVEELLVAEDGFTCPPPCYKLFVLDGRILKLFYFGPKFQQSRKVDVACVDTEHRRCDTAWLKANLGNFNTKFNLPAKPHCWNELLQAALRVSTEIERFVLLKFYVTNRGAVFGGISHDFDEWAW